MRSTDIKYLDRNICVTSASSTVTLYIMLAFHLALTYTVILNNSNRLKMKIKSEFTVQICLSR